MMAKKSAKVRRKGTTEEETMKENKVLNMGESMDYWNKKAIQLLIVSWILFIAFVIVLYYIHAFS